MMKKCMKWISLALVCAALVVALPDPVPVEATSALDPTTTKSILALLKEINEKYGITIVSSRSRRLLHRHRRNEKNCSPI